MKLAEALILRKDLQTRMQQLRERMTLNALVQEGEKPAEDPYILIKELENISTELESLITKINLTNASEIYNGESITALLSRREVLNQRISVMRSLIESASSVTMRSSHREVKIYSTVEVSELRKQTDDLSKQLRDLDMKIQSINWTTEIK